MLTLSYTTLNGRNFDKEVTNDRDTVKEVANWLLGTYVDEEYDGIVPGNEIVYSEVTDAEGNRIASYRLIG